MLSYLKRSISYQAGKDEELKAISPFFLAERITAPVMLVHGEDDVIVDYEQSAMMHRALTKAKKDVRLVTLKNEDHYLQGGSTRLQALQAMVGFLNQHLRSAP